MYPLGVTARNRRSREPSNYGAPEPDPKEPPRSTPDPPQIHPDPDPDPGPDPDPDPDQALDEDIIQF